MDTDQHQAAPFQNKHSHLPLWTKLPNLGFGHMSKNQVVINDLHTILPILLVPNVKAMRPIESDDLNNPTFEGQKKSYA